MTFRSIITCFALVFLSVSGLSASGNTVFVSVSGSYTFITPSVSYDYSDGVTFTWDPALQTWSYVNGVDLLENGTTTYLDFNGSNITIAPDGSGEYVYTHSSTLSSEAFTYSLGIFQGVGPDPDPELEVSPTSFTSQLDPGESEAFTNAYTVRNSVTGSSPATISYQISSDASWLTISGGTSFTTSGTTTQSHSFDVDATGLSAGDYNGTITVSSTTTGVSSKTISVSLTVFGGPAELEVTPASLSYQHVVGESETYTDAFQVRNSVSFSDPSTVDYQLASDASWLSVSSSNFDTAGTAYAAHDLSIDTAQLTAGSHSATITVSTTTAGISDKTITVNLTVDNVPADLEVTPASLTYEMAQGDDAQDILDAIQVRNPVSNSDPATVTYQLAAATEFNWLTVSSPNDTTSGTTSNNHDTGLDISELPPGTYTGTITASTATAGIVDKTINVTLTVLAPNAYTEEEEDCGTTCAQCEPGSAGESNADVASLFYESGIGTGSYGQESFALYLEEEAAPVVAQPSVLQLRDSTDGYWAGIIDVVEDGNGDYRQILTDEVLVDIVTVTANSFEIRFYHRFATETKSGGVYTIAGGRNPYSKTLIENPLVSSVADTDQVAITEYTDSAALPTDPNEFNYFAFEYTASSLKWDLDRGLLASGASSPTILDTISVTCEWIESNTKRKDTREVRNSAGTLEEKIVTIYADVVDDDIIDEDEKDRPTERITDPDGTALTEAWEYTAFVEGSETVYNLTYEEDAWGRWTEYVYESAINSTVGEFLIEKVVSGFEGSVRTDAESLCRVVSYQHSPDHGVTNVGGVDYAYHRTTMTSKLLGQTVSVETLDRYADNYPDYNTVRTVETIEGSYEVDKAQYAQVDQAGRRMVKRWLGEDLYETYDYAIDSSDQLTTTQKRGSLSGGIVTDGTETITVVDESGNLLSRESKDIATGQTLSDMVVTTMDDFGRPTRIDYALDSTYETQTFGCCGLDSATGRDGATVTYARGYATFDSVNRRYEEQTRSVTDGQGGTSDITQRSYYNTQGRLIAQTVEYDSSTVLTTYEATYNLAGELTQSENVLNEQTTYSRVYQASPKRVVETTTYPTSPSTTRIETYFPDGSLEKLSGTAVNGYVMDRGVSAASGGFVYTTDKTTYQDAGVDTSEWAESFYDGLGRLGKTHVSDEDVSGYAETRYHYYDNTSLLEKTVDPDGVTTVYEYDERQRPKLTAVLYNPAAATANLDQEVETAYAIVQKTVDSAQVWVQRTTQTVAPDVTADQIVTIAESALDGSKVWNTQEGVETETAITRDRANAEETVTTTFADGSYQVLVSRYGLPVSEDYYRADATQLSGTSFRYDERGRLDESIDARNGTTSFVYDDLDRLKELTTPDPDTTSSAAGDEPQTTKYFYVMGRGQIERIELPDHTVGTSKEQHFTYHATGELDKQYGARTYPVEYDYDYRGRLKSMTTWQDFNESTGAGISGSAETQWQYFGKSGALEKKIYPAPSGAGSTTEVVYAYTPGGRLDTKTNARSQVTDYAYDTLGRLDTVDYLDDATIDLDFDYNAAGQIDQVDDAVLGVLDYTYTDGRLTDEDYTTSATALYGVNIDRSFDSFGRLDDVGYTLGSATGTTDFGYETGSSRLDTVTANGITHTYSYEALSGLVSGVTSGNKLTVTKVWDKLNRLKSITSNTTSITEGNDSRSWVYAYNAANQRDTATMAHEADALNNTGGAYWDYSYDDLGQVTGGVKKLVGSGTAINGYNYGYTFDEIGNRTQTSTNGQTENWTPNLLNEYDDYDVSRYLNILGQADATATVTVNSAASTRTGDLFYKQLDYTGEPSPNDAQWQSITIDAILTGGGHNNADRKASTSGNLYLAPNATVPVYDADGNLDSDGRWHYTWDSENRLTAMETLAVAYNAGAPRQKLEFVYDYIGRRVQKKVFSWDLGSSSFVVDSATLFIYDGWNMLYESTTEGSVTTDKSYIWGTDLSGSLQGAGGVGGLLAIEVAGSQYFPTYDGNGNVTALVDDVIGSIAAEYEYGPFGELLRSTGAIATENPYRFSTKYTDDETGLLYYGYRYYNSDTGRWLSRDPIGETGGLNLYGFVGNDGVNSVDILGLLSNCECEELIELLRGGDGVLKNRIKESLTTEGLSENDVNRLIDDLILIGKKGDDLGRAILSKAIFDGLKVKNVPGGEPRIIGDTLELDFDDSLYDKRLYDVIPQLGTGEFDVEMAKSVNGDAWQGATVVAHELGHLFIGIPDPINVPVVQNRIARSFSRNGIDSVQRDSYGYRSIFPTFDKEQNVYVPVIYDVEGWPGALGASRKVSVNEFWQAVRDSKKAVEHFINEWGCVE